MEGLYGRQLKVREVDLFQQKVCLIKIKFFFNNLKKNWLDPAAAVVPLASENRNRREAPDSDSTYIDILKKQSKLDESDDEIAGYSPKISKIINDSDDDEVFGEYSPKKSKKVVDNDFDDGAGPSKSNSTDFNSEIKKKSKILKKLPKPTASSKDLLDL